MIAADSPTFDCRDAYANALVELAEGDERFVALVNDSVGSSKLGEFKRRFPDRLIDVGIAEANMVGIASGLANGGRIPFVSAAACFMTARALEQIKVDVAYTGANVKLCGMSPGVAYGALGPTHHSIEDVAWLRAIPGMTVIVPADPIETDAAIRAVAAFDGPCFVRVSRMAVPAVHASDYRFQIGRAHEVRSGSDVTLIANGTMVARALEAAEQLESDHSISAAVLSLATVKPLDIDAVVGAAASTGAIVTIEEHNVRGGLGAAVAEAVVSNHPVPMRLLGVPDTFAPTGSPEWLLEHFGLTARGIQDAVLDLLDRASR